MIKWLIIGGVIIVLIGIIVFMTLISKKNKKKNEAKLDEKIKKFKEEQESLTKKQQTEEAKKKEEEAFANITLTDDVEDEFADVFEKPFKEEKSAVQQPVKFDPTERSPEFNNDFFQSKLKTKKSNSRNDDFEDFLNEHSYTRRVLDEDLLKQIKSLPPKLKAIVLGNIFNKFED